MDRWRRIFLAAALAVACSSRAEPPAAVAVRFLAADGGMGEVVTVEKIVRSEDEWRRILSPEQYRVMRMKGTEPAYCGAFVGREEAGLYACAGCGLPLFSSRTKFHSGTGWPSFFQPVARENVARRLDPSHGMIRHEILCARCDAHLGHVFPDGPPPTGLRYCLNSISLTFIPADSSARAGAAAPEAAPPPETATFAAGCFWGVEAAFAKLPGVTTTVGYMGGALPHPTYQDVCSNQTGHAEVVRVVYDPRQVSYERLLELFWTIHDPTSKNRQGPDIGSQYRSAIFFHDARQQTLAETAKERLNQSGRFRRPIATEIAPAKEFYRAEEYHQRYYDQHPDYACPLPTVAVGGR